MIDRIATPSRFLSPAAAAAAVLLVVCTAPMAPAQTPPDARDTAPTTQAADPFADSLQTEQGRERLIELIKQQALDYQAQNPPEATTQPSTTQPGTLTIPAPSTTPAVDLTPPPPDKPQPKVVVKQTTATNNDAWMGEAVPFEFEITNEGQGPLAIHLKATCGCIKVSPDRIIEPGKTEKVGFSVAPSRTPEVSKSVTLQTNDRNSPSIQLEGKAKQKVSFVLEPENITFGLVKRDAAPQKKTLKLKKGEAGAIQPKVQSVDNQQITATLKEIQPGEEYELEIVAAPPWPATGLMQGLIKLETGIARTPVQEVRVYATVQPRVQAMPRQFTIHRLPDQETTLETRLVWDGPPATVRDVKVNSPNLTARLDPRADGQFIVLSVPANLDADAVHGLYQVTVSTDDAETPVIQIPVFVMTQTALAPAKPGQAQPSAAGVQRANTGPSAAPQPSAATQPAAPAGADRR